MSTVAFTCPHCLSAFEIDASMAGRSVCCPACGGALFVPETESPGETPPADVPPLVYPSAKAPSSASQGWLEPPPIVGPHQDVSAPTMGQQPALPLAVQPRAYAPPPVFPVPPTVYAPPLGSTLPIAQAMPLTSLPAAPGQKRVRHLSREEKALRRFRRNLVMLVVGLLVLIAALAFLLQSGGDGGRG
jgi:hypothetical protein